MKITQVKCFIFWLVITAGVSFSSCKSKPKDADIRTSVNAKIKSRATSATITASVNAGVVTLNGNCPDTDCKTTAESAAKEVTGVTQVVNNISVYQPAPQAPVEISDDAPLKASVDEALRDYKDVTATIQNGVVTLQGSIERDDLQKLMMKLNSLNPRKVENKLILK